MKFNEVDCLSIINTVWHNPYYILCEDLHNDLEDEIEWEDEEEI